MYNIHDFLARRCSIVIFKQEQFEPTMKWFRQYGLRYRGFFLDDEYNYGDLSYINFCVGYGSPSLKDLLGDKLNDSLIVGTTGESVTIEYMDFEENRLYDPNIINVSYTIDPNIRNVSYTISPSWTGGNYFTTSVSSTTYNF